MIGEYPPILGGVASHLSGLSKALTDLGHEVHIVTYGFSHDNVHGVKTINFPFLRGSSFVWGASSLTKKIVERYNFDLIHAHYILPQGLVGAIAKRTVKKPLIITSHGTDLLVLGKNYFYRQLIRRIGNYSDKFIVVSEALKKKAIELKIKPKKLICIPNGVDLKKFSPNQVTSFRKELNLKDEAIVLFVGSLVENKGVDSLIQAFLSVTKTFKNAKLVIVGDGPLKSKLEKLATKLKGSVIFTGYRTDVPQILTAVDVLVLPSRSEGLGEVLLEAMASGKPVVATNVGGIPELVKNFENGIIVEPENPSELAEAIISILSNPDLAKKLSENGLKFVKKFGWDIIANEVIKVYGEVLAM